MMESNKKLASAGSDLQFAQSPPQPVMSKPMYSNAASKYDASKDPFSNNREVQKKKTMLDYLNKSKEYSETVRSNSKETQLDKEKVR